MFLAVFQKNILENSFYKLAWSKKSLEIEKPKLINRKFKLAQDQFIATVHPPSLSTSHAVPLTVFFYRDVGSLIRSKYGPAPISPNFVVLRSPKIQLDLYIHFHFPNEFLTHTAPPM